MPEADVENGSPNGKSMPPVGLWCAVVANALAVCAGAVFLFAAPGGRFRGMEPEAAAFIALCLLAVASGLLIALPLSLIDLFRRGRRLWGAAGAFLAFTPYPVAQVVMYLVADLKGLSID
jgi:hypothetical protein